MEKIKKKYTRDEILNFNENDWNFRRSSGFSGYDHKDYPNDEQKWIYATEYNERRMILDDYRADYTLIHDFRLDQLPLGEYPDYHIHEFLNKKYFK